MCIKEVKKKNEKKCWPYKHSKMPCGTYGLLAVCISEMAMVIPSNLVHGHLYLVGISTVKLVSIS